MSKVLLLDNYDSFTYNLFHLLEDLDLDVSVIRNDEPYLELYSQSDAVVLSPGPSLPKQAGRLLEVIDLCVRDEKPLLGVCLGLQGIAQYFGGELMNMPTVRHGESVSLDAHSTESVFFKGLTGNLKVGLYHSWAVEVEKLPTDFQSTAEMNGLCMALEHKYLPITAVQFHPESVLTPCGKQMLQNWKQHAFALKGE